MNLNEPTGTEMQVYKPMQKADMHVHLGSLEPTFNDTTEYGPEKLGSFYHKLCRMAVDFLIQPSLVEYFGIDMPKINKMYIELQHDPQSMLRHVRQKGMDYFAVTDHDSIEPVMRLLNETQELVDLVIVGEEVTTHYRDGIHLHVGVYGLNEEQHKYIQKAKSDLRKELLPYLKEEGLMHSLNHPFQIPVSTKGEKFTMDDLLELRELFAIVEKRNGLMPPRINERSAEFFKNNASIAGSDSHRRFGAGTTFTAAHAKSKEEFLAAIREGRGLVYGKHGSKWNYIAEILDKAASFGSIARFAIPEEASEETRSKIERVLESSDEKIKNFENQSLASVNFQGKWRLIEVLMFLIMTGAAPFYADDLLHKDLHIL
jgi:predicted metal-dependent phosphoesterase TrpH